MFGLQERDIHMIETALSHFKEVKRAKIFGSRAIGNYKKGSDIDIAIFGKNITNDTTSQLNDLLNEVYPLPYFFDLLHYEEVANDDLKNHIDQVGIEIYSNGANMGDKKMPN